MNQLNEEYATLAEKLTNKLGRKHVVLFVTDSVNDWAAAVVHALGTINFLFEDCGDPYIPEADVYAYFDVEPDSVSCKSEAIRKLFKLNHWDEDFSTRAMMDIHPFKTWVFVNDELNTIDVLPKKYQDMLLKARASGGEISFKSLR
jgi:hypothetical protein